MIMSSWLQRWDGGGVKGSADLAARFVLRAVRLLSPRGQLGYIATNALVQGATLNVGLIQTTAGGLTIRRGRSSRPWPSSSANLEIVDIWASRNCPVGVNVLPAGSMEKRFHPSAQTCSRLAASRDAQSAWRRTRTSPFRAATSLARDSP